MPSLFGITITRSGNGKSPNVPTPPDLTSTPGKWEEVGAPGTIFYSGFLDQEEYNVDLQGEKAIEVYTRMLRSDGMVKAMIRSIVLPARSAVLNVRPASDKPEDVHIANVVQHNLLNMGGMVWDDFVRQAFTNALGYGFAIHEKVFSVPGGKPNIQEIDGEEIIALYKLAVRLPKSIYRWHIDRTGELRGITQKTFIAANQEGFDVEAKRNAPADYVTGGSWVYPTIPIGRLFVMSLDREGANFRGESILRSAYKHWFYKDALLRIQAVAAERHGVGVPYAILRENIRIEERNAVAAALRSLHSHEKGYFLASEAHLSKEPNSFGILDMKATGLRSLDTAILYHDRQMALSILADFLSLGSGQGGNANVMHRDKSSLFFNSLKGIVRQFEQTLNAMVIHQIVDLNWPSVAAYPEAEMGSLETKDFERLGRSLALMTGAGLLTPGAELEQQLREMAELPPLPSDESGNPIRPTTPPPVVPGLHPKVPGMPETGAPGATPPGVVPGSPGTPDEGIQPKKGPMPTGPEEPAAAVPMSERTWHRELRNSERQVDFAAIDDALTQGVARLKAAGRSEAIALGRALVAKKGTKRLERALGAALHPVLLGLRRMGAEQVKREHGKARGKTHADPPTLPDVGPDELGATLARRTLARIDYWMNHYEGEIGDEAVASAAETALGVVARYAVTTPFNEGRSEAALAYKDEIDHAERSALLDNHTCDDCEALDGTEYEMDSADYDDNEPPSHCDGNDLCRCVYVYVWKTEGEA